MRLATYQTTNERTLLDWKADPSEFDNADEPEWAIWETMCRTYRIIYGATSDTYSPRCVRITTVNGNKCSEWFVCGPNQSTLEDAQHVCEQHAKRKKHAKTR